MKWWSWTVKPSVTRWSLLVSELLTAETQIWGPEPEPRATGDLLTYLQIKISAALKHILNKNKDKGSYKFASRLCKNCKKIGWQLMDDNWLTVKNILQVDKLQKGHGLGLCKLILFANEGKFNNISPRDTRILLRNVFHNCTWHLLLNHSTRQQF